MQIEKAVYAFQIKGTPISCIEFGHGHINRTLKIDTDAGESYILQKINKYVFKNPFQVMANASAVTNYLRQRVSDPGQCQHFIPTHDGTFCYRDEFDEFWKMSDFVGGICLDMPESDNDFYQSGVAFGRFQQMLSEFPAETLFETIPEFHNTIDRFRQLKESIAADVCGRLKNVRPEVEFSLMQEEKGSILQRMRQNGQLPLRVTHNDTKLNNVMLDAQTRKPLCVIDLDTVMPGLSVHDFGDSIRFGAATSVEDEKDLSKMNLDLHLFEVYTRGFLEEATALTDIEVEMLTLGAYTMTLEVGIRFLKDYLDGDLYFKTAYPEHNLVRARTQLKLVSDMNQNWDTLNEIVARVSAEVRS